MSTINKKSVYTRPVIFTIVAPSDVAILSGCATPARVDNMSYHGSPMHHAADSRLKQTVTVRDVTGGKATNPLWRSEVSSMAFRDALIASPRSIGLFSKDNPGEYELTVNLEDVGQPLMGASFTVTSRIRYTLVDVETGRNLYGYPNYLVDTITYPFH